MRCWPASWARAEASRSAEIVRVGVESAGHYHRTLVARLRAGGFEVVELNPAAVKEARSQQLLRRLKSDARDIGAMAEMMIRGGGPGAGGAHRCVGDSGGVGGAPAAQGGGPLRCQRPSNSLVGGG